MKSSKSIIAKNSKKVNVEILDSNLPAIIAKDIAYTNIKDNKEIIQLLDDKQIINNKSNKLNKNILDLLNAQTISDKAQKTLSGKKSIFKVEHNNKNSRSKIRTKLYGTNNSFGLLELYLKNLKENKLEEAEKIFSTISEICKDSYNAEISFSNYAEYATDNLDVDKLSILKTFISVRKAITV